MSVNQFLNGKLNLIAGAGGGSVIADDNTFTGTTAEVEAAIADGLIENDTIVFITDDVTEGGNGEAITIEMLDTYDEIMANTDSGKVAGAAGVKEGFEQTNEKIAEVNNSLDELNTNLEELEASFQDGCNTIVAGCTTYGSTPVSNSPNDIVESIKNIYTNRYNSGVTDADNRANASSTNYKTGYNTGVSDTKKGTATAAQVLTGYTFTNSSSIDTSGSMANNGAWTSAPTTTGKVTIPAGYHNGSGYVDTSALTANGKLVSFIQTATTGTAHSSLTVSNVSYSGNLTRTTVVHTSANYTCDLFKIRYGSETWKITLSKACNVNGTNRSSGYVLSHSYKTSTSYFIVES